jgi:hypothetical protein
MTSRGAGPASPGLREARTRPHPLPQSAERRPPGPPERRSAGTSRMAEAPTCRTKRPNRCRGCAPAQTAAANNASGRSSSPVALRGRRVRRAWRKPQPVGQNVPTGVGGVRRLGRPRRTTRPAGVHPRLRCGRSIGPPMFTAEHPSRGRIRTPHAHAGSVSATDLLEATP